MCFDNIIFYFIKIKIKIFYGNIRIFGFWIFNTFNIFLNFDKKKFLRHKMYIYL